MKIKVNHKEEVFISRQPIGSAFVSCGDLWVKVTEADCIIVGKSELVQFTGQCMAWPVSNIEVTV